MVSSWTHHAFQIVINQQLQSRLTFRRSVFLRRGRGVGGTGRSAGRLCFLLCETTFSLFPRQRDTEIIVAEQTNAGTGITKPVEDALIEALCSGKFDVLVFDPVVATHLCRNAEGARKRDTVRSPFGNRTKDGAKAHKGEARRSGPRSAVPASLVWLQICFVYRLPTSA